MSENPEAKQTEDAQAVASYYAGGSTNDDLNLLTEDQVELAMQGNPNTNTEAVDAPTAEPEVKPEATPEVVVAPPQEDNKDILLKNAYEELNKAKQEAANFERMKTDPAYRNKKLGIEEEVKVDENKDYLADEYHATQEHELNKLKQWKAEQEAETAKRSAENADRTAKQKQDDTVDDVFREINALGEKFPSLKTSIAFREVDTEYSRWQKEVGADKVIEYINNPDARANITAPKLSMDDLNKAKKLYDAHDKYQEQAEVLKEGITPSFEKAFKDTPHYEEAMKLKYGGTSVSNEEALNQRVAQINAAPTTLSTTTGDVGTDDAAQMMADLDRLDTTTLGRPLNAAEEARFKQIMEFIVPK